MNRIEKIKQCIPSNCFFEEIFENPAFAPKILADIKLNFDLVEHENLFNCSPILKKNEEFHLFRKFNYLKYRLIKNTRGFEKSDKQPSPKPRPATNLNRIGEKKIIELESLIFRIQEIRNLILKSNMRLVVKPISRYFDNDTFDREEFVSNGYMHILKAIDAFDHRLGFKFSTYCVNALKTNLYRDCEYLKRHQSRLENNEYEVAVQDFSIFSEINSEYNKKTVERIFRCLKRNKKQKYIDVLKMTYGIGCDRLLQKEIASKLGMSRTRIQQIRDKAFEMVQHLAYDPLI